MGEKQYQGSLWVILHFYIFSSKTRVCIGTKSPCKIPGSLEVHSPQSRSH